MQRKLKKLLAAVLAVACVMQAATVNAFAAESVDTSDTDTAHVSGEGTLENPKVTVTESTSKDADGNTTTTTTTTTEAAGTNGEGAQVNRAETVTNETVTNRKGDTTKESGSTEGHETTRKEKTENVPTVTVTLTPGSAQTGTSGTADQTTTGTTKEQNPDDYDTTTTTETDRKVTAEMGETKTVTGNGETVDVETGLTPICPVWSDEKQDVSAPDSTDSVITPDTAQPDGFDFLYTGHGEYSHFYGTYIDTNENGEEEKGTTGITHFQLTDMSDPDAEQKTIFTTYCVELGRGAKKNYWYTIDNLESKDYYKTEDAENHVRAILNNGYWGTVDGTGSLEQMKTDLKAAGEDVTGLTDAQIELLTEGEALAATQMAIWQYANLMKGVEVPEYSDAEAKNRIEKVMEYLADLSEEARETQVITEDKFIDQMSLTVKDKAEEAGNDAQGSLYNVDLTFSMVVQPSAENDDLIIKVISGGQVVYTARLAGDSKEGETFGKILPDADGNYMLEGLQLVAGQDIDFDLKLEGAQYLERGVYIFTSEEREITDEEGNVTETRSSQTQVGIAEGTRKVDVSMNVTLRFDVEEAVVTAEREWGKRWSKTYKPNTDTGTTESTVEVKTVINTAVPRTGDISGLCLALSVLSGSSLAVWSILEMLRRKAANALEEVR